MAVYVLYGYPESGSASVEAAMVAGGIPFQLKDLDPEIEELQSPAFLAINPRGQVPTVTHPDGTVITEVPAILSHLADAHPGCGLAPAPGTSARAQHDRWLAFVHANCYEAVLRLFYAERYTSDPSAAESVSKAALDYIIQHFNLLADAIEDGPFLFGEGPMSVDFLIWIVTTWLVEEDLSLLDPKITRLAQAVAMQPELAQTVARHTGG